MRSSIFAFLPLLAACTPAAPVAPAREPASLKIATWNLEHLAERNGEGCRPRSDADYAELRRHADALAADIVAIEEVESRAAAERVFDPRRYDVIVSNRPQSLRGGTCYDRPGQKIGHQDVGFAIRKGIRWTRNPDYAALALGNPDLRWGVDVTVDAGAPLRLLAVHLKSGCSAGRSQADADCTVLFDQLPVLERWIDARAAAGERFAVLGDWNRRLAQPDDAFLKEIDDHDPKGAELDIVAGTRSAHCKARYPDFIDHIVTGTSATAGIIGGSFEEYRYGAPEAAHPSDHCPVSVRMLR